jgi:hypothetical protein
MVQRRQRERSLFEVLLPDGHKLWPEWLRRIDTLLEDECGKAPRSARLQMGGYALAHDGEDGHAGRESVDQRKRVDARVRIEEDRGIEVLERGLERESLVVIGSGAAAISGRSETLRVDRHRTGRGMADDTNRQVGEVGRLICQYHPERGPRVGAEHPCASAIRRVSSERAKADGHGIGEVRGCEYQQRRDRRAARCAEGQRRRLAAVWCQLARSRRSHDARR